MLAEDSGSVLALIQVLLVCATLLVTIAVAFWVWRQTKIHFEFDKTLRYIERWNEPGLRESIAQIFDIENQLEVAENPTELAIELSLATEEQKLKTRGKIRAVYNILQEVGAAHKRNVLHNGYFEDVFASIVQRHFTAMSRYVLAQRAVLNRASLLEDWELLAIKTASGELARSGRHELSLPHHLRSDCRVVLSDVAVFGYGSLVHPDSLGKSVRGYWAPYQIARAWPASLKGYKRTWNYAQQVQLVADNQMVQMSFLGIEPAGDEECSGVLVPVLASDLEMLDSRERDYRRVDVTHRINYLPEFVRARNRYRRVFTYIPKEPLDPNEPVTIGQSYVDILKDAQKIWRTHHSDFFADLDYVPDSATVIDGAYRFDSPDQNRAAGR